MKERAARTATNPTVTESRSTSGCRLADRGKWVCKCCEKLVQAPVAPHVIDKGLPKMSLLTQVLVYLDHLPLYRHEGIFERAGPLIARSTLAQ